MKKIDKIDEIVREYIDNIYYDACDAMEDITDVLDGREPYYYNKIKIDLLSIYTDERDKYIDWG